MPSSTRDDRDVPALATVRQAAIYLALSRSTVYALMDQGSLRFVRIGRARRVPWSALRELVETSTVSQR